MTTKISPPTYKKGKSYELYKQELLAWAEVTDLHVNKRGVAIALSLPEDDESAIREKVFNQLSLDELKADDGLNKLITFLDKHLAKDDLSDSLEKFEDFEDFQRVEGQSVQEYISIFDSKYRKIEKKNMKLPPEILAFKLLRKANIKKEEKMLVLTGMNYDQKDTLYDEAKKSLKKFKGEGGSSPTQGAAAIKLEPTYLAENEEALMAAGYVKAKSGGQHSYNSRRGGRQYDHGSYGRGYYGNQRGTTRHTAPARQQPLPVKKKNPVGADGHLLTCKSCGSFRHLIGECPDSWENLAKVNMVEDENVVLFTGYHKEEVATLGSDARNCAVLDSACSSTVCGENWVNSYIGSLDQCDKDKVQRFEGERTFKFGGGTRLKSKAEYQLPGVMAGKQVTIKTDVVESDIPLLLSRSAMKTAGVKMDLENDTATIFGKEVVLNLTSSGHYCIPIDKSEKIPVENVCLALDEMNEKQRHATLLKLHRQFAHPPMKRFIALLKDADVWEDDYKDVVSQIEEKCDLCKAYAKTPARPVVAMPMASKFNEKVAMDLKQWNGRWILHMIDMWSRYTVSVFINRKRTSDVIDAMMTHWIGTFGVMGSVMTDNGGEFSSDEMREVASILNVKVCTTAGESPFQNGLCERVHAVTDMMLLKLAADYGKGNCQTMLCWANMARNSLQMWNGYSSHQLVFGINPNLPGVMTDQVPAFDGVTSSETFAKHLNVLHTSRKAYIESEANERIRRALRSKVRASEQVYSNGDRVFYKREGRERWLGPAKVVFQDGKVVFVRHGGVFVRVTPNRLIKANGGESNELGENPENGEAESKYRTGEHVKTKEPITSENENESVISEYTTENSLNNVPANLAVTKTVPKADDKIQYQTDSDQWASAKVLGRAGKATGKYKHWFNVQDESNNEQKSVDLGSLPWVYDEVVTQNREAETENRDSAPSAQTFEANIVTEKHDSVAQNLAKEAELEKLRMFNVYEQVEDEGQTVVSTRWVMTNKDGQVKARLVARGFEEEYILPRDSPTIGKGAMKVFLSIASSKNWQVKTTDIKSAFLQGNELDRDIYLRPPKESDTPENMLWKLKHCLYGLKDGARQFYLSVKEELLRLGFKQCDLDPAMFSLQSDGKLNGIICCHVDDFLHAGNEQFEKLMSKLRERFLAGKVEAEDFKYIGFNITQDSNTITVDHSAYMEAIQGENVDLNRTSSHEVLNSEEQTTYRRLIGRLNWAVQGSRPDMAFDMINMSTKLKEANVGDLTRAIKVIRRLNNIKSVISFPKLSQNVSDWHIWVFTDASLGNINNGTGSTGAHIIWLVDHEGNCCPITWQANKIKRVVRSTIAAEALSLQEGLEASYYYRNMVEDIMGIPHQTIGITAYIDNKSVVEAVQSTKLVDDKRLRVDIAAIRELLQTNEVREIKWCPGRLQLANCMTKQGASGYELLQVLQTGKMLRDFF